jgi:hypothetical protein
VAVGTGTCQSEQCGRASEVNYEPGLDITRLRRAAKPWPKGVRATTSARNLPGNPVVGRHGRVPNDIQLEKEARRKPRDELETM